MYQYQFKQMKEDTDSYYGQQSLSTISKLTPSIIARKYTKQQCQQFLFELDRTRQCLEKKGLLAVIGLHIQKGLQKIVQLAVAYFNDPKLYLYNQVSKQIQKKTQNNFMIIAQAIYCSSSQNFLSYINIKSLNDSLQKLKKYTKLSQTFKSNLRTQQDQQAIIIINDMLTKLIYSQNITQIQDRRSYLNNFILQQLLPTQIEGIFGEIAINWLKQKTQAHQQMDKYNVCCKLVFQQGKTSELGDFSETEKQQFKDYRWPLNNQSIKLHLTKTIVGYLNKDGGIIYVGLKEDKQKFITVKGIKLNDEQKIQFLVFLHDDIMKGVYPKEADRRQYEQELQLMEKRPDYKSQIVKQYKCQMNKQFRPTDSKKIEFKINKYVFVDFINVFDKYTYANAKEDRSNLYIVKIKIKKGDTRQLYHVINKASKMPETYFREDKSVKRKSFAEFHTIFYERLSGNPNFISEKIQLHQHCRFNFKSLQ